MALSRRDWNNVVIYAMVGMGMLFLLMNHRITRDLQPGSESQVLPQPAVVLTMSHGQQRIERLGAAWRSVPSLGLAPEQLAAYAEAWQSLRATRVAAMPDEGRTIELSLWLAGEASPRHYLLLQSASEPDAESGQQWYLAGSADIWQLDSSTALSSLLPADWR